MSQTLDMKVLEQMVSLRVINKGWNLIADAILAYPKYENSTKLISKNQKLLHKFR